MAVTCGGEFGVDHAGIRGGVGSTTSGGRMSRVKPGSKALFGWAFGFGFWPQKPKAQPKGLLLKGAFSEAAVFL